MDPFDPIRRAADLSALKDLARLPDPSSAFAEATHPGSRSVHPADREKRLWDLLQLAIGLEVGRRVNHAETARWVFGFAARHVPALLAEVRASREGVGSVGGGTHAPAGPVTPQAAGRGE